MSEIQWRRMDETKPITGQRCLTKMKHGMIEGSFYGEDNMFHGYYWQDLSWYATHWVPVDEVSNV